MLDAALAYVLDNCNKMIACSQQPTTYTEAVTTYALADADMTVGDGNDYTLGNGDTNGRKVTVGAKNGVAVDSAGTATHVALVKTGDTSLRYVTTCDSQVLPSGGLVNFSSWDIEFSDPI